LVFFKLADENRTPGNDDQIPPEPDWQRMEYEQLSEDLRHFTVVGWQSLIAVLALDGVLLVAVFTVIGINPATILPFSTGTENVISFLILLLGSTIGAAPSTRRTPQASYLGQRGGEQ